MSDDLKPGWLGRDIARASARVAEWKEEKMSDDLKERLLALVIIDEVNSDNQLGRDAADYINELEASNMANMLFGKDQTDRAIKAEAQLKAAEEALDSSQSLLAMIYHIGTEINRKFIPAIDWENEDLSKLLAEQITENRAALDPKPTATGETP